MAGLVIQLKYSPKINIINAVVDGILTAHINTNIDNYLAFLSATPAPSTGVHTNPEAAALCDKICRDVR